MRNSRSLVTLVESAVDRTPRCACGGSMIPVDHHGSLWLECAEHDAEGRGLKGRLWSLFGHNRELLLAAEEAA